MALKDPFAGQLKSLIEIHRLTEVVQPNGERKETPVLVHKLWAKENDLAGSESEEGKVYSEVNKSFTIRYRPEVAANGLKMTVLHKNRTYNITRMRETHRQYLELFVTDYE